MSLFWHGFFTIYAFGIRFETSLGKPWVLIDAFFFLLRRYPKAFSQIVCLSRKIFNFLFFGFSEVLHFTPLINPSWVGTEKLRNRTVCVCKVQKQQCVMNHGDLHSPPHFVIPFEIFLPTSLYYCNSKLLEVYTIVKVYTEEAKKLLSPSTQKLLERGVIIILKSWQTNVHLLRFTFRSFQKISIKINNFGTYLSITTGSEGVSFRFPQDFFSQHRLEK